MWEPIDRETKLAFIKPLLLNSVSSVGGTREIARVSSEGHWNLWKMGEKCPSPQVDYGVAPRVLIPCYYLG